ncbi:hypothetical protein UF64_05390 [Thalassospira sp. HJ]|uniref:hypothetical protein n=1 Tax=Thalassospira sp. HJ TaxID=1616823 RepID=UPI0005CF02F4|nr:hypothetical protein [Thalassospira sp. HJ]KJE36285.1 hypothetical protein UF64_05390 [Thalassospira sp. HJ]
MKSAIKHTIAILGLALLSACASPAEFQNMVVTEGIDTAATQNSALKDSIVVKSVDGGEETNPLWTSEISSQAFEKALIASLENANLLAKLDENAPYGLRVTLLDVDQPLFGLDLTVKTRIRYEIIEKDGGKPVFDVEIPATHTATFGDSPFAIQRLRLANEGSAKNNIAAFIERALAFSPDMSDGNVALK